jgi:hypothetical protein
VTTEGESGGAAIPAGAVSTANPPSVSCTTSAGSADADVEAFGATVSTVPVANAPAESGGVAATANGATVVIKSSAGTVLATATAEDATAVLRAAAEAVSSSAVAHDATIDIQSDASPTAGLASVTATSHAPVVQGTLVQALAGLASATATAYDPTVSNISPTPRGRTFVI